jgi:hypothetical protein
MSIMPNPPRSRPGCFAGLLRSLSLLLVLGAFFVLALTAVFAPWGYYLGGHFHILPLWQGWGRMHTPAGDYVVFLYMQPRSSGRSRFPSVGGSGVVCTPRGESFNLRLTGGFQQRVGLDTDGQQMSLSLAQNLNFLGTNQDSRLKFSLYGAWHNPELVLEDRGTVARAFNPDGTLYTGDPHKRPEPSAPLQLTLHQGSRSDFNAACATAKHP